MRHGSRLSDLRSVAFDKAGYLKYISKLESNCAGLIESDSFVVKFLLEYSSGKMVKDDLKNFLLLCKV